MDQSASTIENHPVKDSRFISGSVAPLIEGSEWERFLKELRLTDVEALKAVREGREPGQLITSFVHAAFRQYFVPEDVLVAVKMQWEIAREKSLLGSFLAANSPIHSLEIGVPYPGQTHGHNATASTSAAQHSQGEAKIAKH